MELFTDGELYNSLSGKSLETKGLFKVAVYARTSTIAQADEEKISIPDQIDWAKQICAERGWEFVGSYVDTLPGDVEFDQRPDGARLLEDAKFKLFNLALFYHSSRLAREPWVGLKTISILGKLRVQTYIRNAPMEPVDPRKYIYGANVAAEYLNALSLVGDKQENIARSERVTSGFKNLAQKGILVFKCYGLKKIPKIKIMPDGRQIYTWRFEEEPITISVVKRIANEFLGGKSLRRISRDLIKDKVGSPAGKTGVGSWTPATIKNILTNPAYNGIVRWGKKLGSKYRQGRSESGKQKRVYTISDEWILQGSVNSPKVVDDMTWNLVQERIKQRGKIAGRQLASTSMLPGLVYCGECNRRAYCKTRRVRKNGKEYLRSDFIDQSYFRGLDCRRHLISASKLEYLVLSKLQSRLTELNEKDIDNELSSQSESEKALLTNAISQLNSKLKSQETKQTRLMELYLGGSINKDEFDKQKDKIDSEQTILIEERSRIQAITNDKRKKREALQTLKQLLQMFVKVTNPSLKKEMIHRIIDCIVIYKDRVEIIYKYGIGGTNGLNVKPHPCGYLGDPKKECKCTPRMVMKYQAKLSGPLMDRIDLHINVPSVDINKLISTENSKSQIPNSKEIRKQVIRARGIQYKRFKGLKIYTNASMKNKHIKDFCDIDPQSLLLLKQAVNTYNLSARTYFRLIKVSQTIADLSESKRILPAHVAEALQYRIRSE